MSDQPFRLYDDVKGLLDALGIEKTCVAGLSFGGYTALEFALAYPDRVEGLILVSSGSKKSQKLRRSTGLTVRVNRPIGRLRKRVNASG